MSKSKHAFFSPDSPAWRIAVKFYSPCIYYTPVILDSLVAYAVNRQASAAEGRPSYCGPGWARHGILDTLMRLIWQDSNCSVCTQMIPEVELPINESVKKRFEQRHHRLIDFGRHRRRIATGAAPYRNYDKKMPGKLVGRGHWDFIGDGPAVAALLCSQVVGVGKDINAGYGWVDGFELSRVETDRTAILSGRPIPVHMAQRYGIAGRVEIRSWKPPYWDSRNFAECVVPS